LLNFTFYNGVIDLEVSKRFMMNVVSFKNRSVPVYYSSDQAAMFELLPHKLKELELNFDFRKKWKRIASVELVRDVAVFRYNDGTKLYLEVG
jgi:hypothetical protein